MKFTLGLDWRNIGHSVVANGLTLLVVGGTLYGLSRLGYTPHFCTPSTSCNDETSRQPVLRSVSPPPTAVTEDEESE